MNNFQNVAKEFMAVGSLLCGVSFLFIGPSPLLNIGPSRLWLTIAAFFPFGVGIGLIIVPSTNDIMREAALMGMPVNVQRGKQ